MEEKNIVSTNYIRPRDLKKQTYNALFIIQFFLPNSRTNTAKFGWTDEHMDNHQGWSENKNTDYMKF